MIIAFTISKPQRLMHWKIIIEELGTNNFHIPGIDTIVVDMLSIFKYTTNNQDDNSTRSDHFYKTSYF